MELLLMRHGDAVDQAPAGDGDRWLTPKGRKRSRAAAEALRERVVPAAVWTSPLVRAVQTAEIAVRALGFDEPVTVLRELATGALDKIVHRVEGYDGKGPLMLVGHEPTLSQLVVRWTGYAGGEFSFPKSAVCSLSLRSGGPATFSWMILVHPVQVVTSMDEVR